jgi:hypothetical protein
MMMSSVPIPMYIAPPFVGRSPDRLSPEYPAPGSRNGRVLRR